MHVCAFKGSTDNPNIITIIYKDYQFQILNIAMADMKLTYIVSAMFRCLSSHVKYSPVPLWCAGAIITIDIQCPIWCNAQSRGM